MIGRWTVAALLVYLGLALVQLYPAWLDLEQVVVGDWSHPDMISNHWLYRWVADQLLSGHSLLHNDRYYHPVGDAPWLAGNGSDAIPYALVAALLPWPASTTVWVALILVLNGLGGYALCRSVGARGAGALVGGAVLATLPYVARELEAGRFAQAPVYWLAFFLAAWIRLLDAAPTEGSWRPGRALLARAALAGLLFGATAFTYWYYGLWAAWVGAIFFAARPRWRALIPFVPVALAITAPPLALFLKHWAAIPGATEDVFPHPLTAVTALNLGFPVISNAYVPGIALLAPLALLAARLRHLRGGVRALLRAGSWWELPAIVTALAFYALALGPRLPPGGEGTVPGPFLLVYGIASPLRRFWWSYRHALVFALMLLPFVAHAVDALVHRARERWPRAGLALTLPALLVLLLPFDLASRQRRLTVVTSWWDPPAAYEHLARLPDGAVIELPIHPDVALYQQALSYQWVHGKKLVNGHALWVDRVRPQAWDDFVAGNSFLAEVAELESGKVRGRFRFAPPDVDRLIAADVRYLVVNTEYFPGDLQPLAWTYRSIFDQLFGPPVVGEDSRVLIWDLAGFRGEGLARAATFTLEGAWREGDRRLRTGVSGASSHGWRVVPPGFPAQLPPDPATQP